MSNTIPVSPYSTWATAATNIQNAVDVSAAGDLVLVSNGVYKYGGRIAYGSISNRVAVTRPITVQSVNGSAVTTIQGFQISATTNGNGAVRCVYLTNGATLVGFTLTNGATRAAGDLTQEESGGGVWCASTNAFVYNCLITHNAAFNYGGGAYSGTLSNCVLTGNTSLTGGGAGSNVLVNCTLTANLAKYGGGTAFGILVTNCLLTGNLANLFGGGAAYSAVENCTLAGNSGTNGGAAYASALTGCLVTNNTAMSSGGGTESCSLTNCTLLGNHANANGGGADQGVMFDCLVTGNSATNGGAISIGTSINCRLIGNTALNQGGGIYLGISDNCAVESNSASWGGGCYSATLNNCTVSADSASIGGGAYNGQLNNCIVYYNSAAAGPNYVVSTFNFSCTTPLPGGPGNLGAAPLLADSFSLSATSPCRGAGSQSFVSGTDIDGKPWANPPSMGCDEFYVGTATGALGVTIQAALTNVAAGFPLNFAGNVTGLANANYWDFDDGTFTSNSVYASHAWATPGNYNVVFWVYNDSNPGGISATTTVQVVAQPVFYVRTSNPGSLPPYNSWATAATNLQDAVNAATVAGSLVVVSNGIYASRGTVVNGTLTNRVAVTIPLTLQSVNGPAATIIQGNKVAGTQTGNSAMRCVYLTDGSALIGFTITNGATRATGDSFLEQGGAGVWCGSPSVVVSNCILAGNVANTYGGGIFSGTVTNCHLINNSAFTDGGGAFSSTLNNCNLAGNSSTNGGGAYLGTLNGCTLTGNTGRNGGGANLVALTACYLNGNAATNGGGAYAGSLNNCTLTNNSAASSGGAADNAGVTSCILVGNSAANGAGTYLCELTNCVLTLNKASNNGGGANSGTLLLCTLTNNSASSYGGGIYSATLNNCTLADNSAGSWGGGAFSGSLSNCLLVGNSANYGGGACSSALTNCVVVNNSANNGGGASTCTLAGCYLTNNSAASGGGAGGSTVINCTLAGNMATSSGGGVNGGTITNCLLIENSASTGGGAAYSAVLYNCRLISNSAGIGGGADTFCTLNNCAIIANTALTNGGGEANCTLNNCTLTENSAALYGGGAYASTLNNCIVYYNSSATFGPNYFDSTLNYSCTTPLPDAGSNITAEPLLTDAFHLSAMSPCRGTGSATYVKGADIDGDLWANPPSIGCDEFYAAAFAGPLSASVQSDTTNVVAGFIVNFSAVINGSATANYWDLGDGTVVSNRLAASHAWDVPGAYNVTFHIFNSDNPDGVSATVTVNVVAQPVYYVAAGNPNPMAPYTSWATAATNIQDAVNTATVSGALVLVTNGVYGYGGKAVFGVMTNRVAVTVPLTLQSVNGPGATWIIGNQVSGTTNGDTAVRCVYLANGSSLVGFTLTNGATRASGDPDREQSGGGLWCASTTVLVSNCVLAGNSAYDYGGGTYAGTLNQSTLSGNFSDNAGGGDYYGILNNSILSGNIAVNGGGSYYGVLTGCTISNNSAASSGGGIYMSMADNCLLEDNFAFSSGGGAYSAVLNNCALLGNIVNSGGPESIGGGSCGGVLTNCVLNNNFSSYLGGGSQGDALYNCKLTNNLAVWYGGGAYGSTMVGCILASNCTALTSFLYSGAQISPMGGGAYQSGLSNCLLVGNASLIGGGLCFGNATNCLFLNNTATGAGGGSDTSSLVNCILTGNSTSGSGGGDNSSTLSNCALTGNSAADTGGGANGSVLYNCTLTGNSAELGGGIYKGILDNCIVYYNSANIGANYDGSAMNFCCTTPLPAAGTNLAAEPLLADAMHLSAGSPCRGVGNVSYVRGTDIDGEEWADPPSIGCDEFYAATAVGPLNASLQASITNTIPGVALDFSASISGLATANYWDFGDGTVVSNQPYASHAWNTPGVYKVVFWVFNNSNPTGVSAGVTVNVMIRPIYYVAAGNPNPAAPYTSWTTAATNIQDAVNAATVAGALVLVTNGAYGYGGEVVYGTTSNRVAVTRPLILQSVNGPGATWIVGNPVLGDAAVRCVYLANGASLLGFTLTNGATRLAGDANREQSGGAIWCASSSVLVSNCVLIGNYSSMDGCGAYSGMLDNCRLLFNTGNIGEYSISGEAAYYSTLSNCLIATNYCHGVSYSTLDNCSIVGNSGNGANNSTMGHCTLSSNGSGGASVSVLNECWVTNNFGCGASASTVNDCLLAYNTGGGASSSTIDRSALIGNFAGAGAGAESCTINNSILMGNTSYYQAGGTENSVLTNCALVGNFAGGGGGGAAACTLVNCTVISNSASYNSGGTYGSTLDNCIVYYNLSISGTQTNVSNFTNATLNNCCTLPLPSTGVNNFTNDPIFVSLPTENLRLQSNSPCIDAGSNVYISNNIADLDERPRLVGGTVDIGAYEYQGPGMGEFIGWLQQYGLPTDGSADYADSDDTGMNNWQKWIAGLNPTNVLSVLKISTPVFTHSPAGLVVSWQSVTNVMYYLQRSTNLTVQPSFTSLQSNIVGQAGTTSFTDTTATNGAAFFYRVGVQH